MTAAGESARGREVSEAQAAADGPQPWDPAGLERELEALERDWGDEYDQIWVDGDGEWGAHHKDAADADIIAASAAELDAAIRADQARRGGGRP